VREYLLDNPGLLEEVIEALEDSRCRRRTAAQQQVIVENRDALFQSRRSFVAGNPDGDVTLVEFFDFNCSYCRQMLPTLMELIEGNPICGLS
jgi:protein-disulfide isomerase